jgi:hypothetical protein
MERAARIALVAQGLDKPTYDSLRAAMGSEGVCNLNPEHPCTKRLAPYMEAARKALIRQDVLAP